VPPQPQTDPPPGEDMAARALGEMYKEGERVPEDYAEAAKWHEKAGGGPQRNSSSGECTGTALGTPRDYVLLTCGSNCLAVPGRMYCRPRRAAAAHN